jgi:hypothetical protein
MSAEYQAHGPLVSFLACQLAIYISSVLGPRATCVFPCLSVGYYVSWVPGPWASCVFPCLSVGYVYQLSARPMDLLCFSLPVSWLHVCQLSARPMGLLCFSFPVGCIYQLSTRPMGHLCFSLLVSWLYISAECQTHRPLVFFLTCQLAVYISRVPGLWTSCVFPLSVNVDLTPSSVSLLYSSTPQSGSKAEVLRERVGTTRPSSRCPKNNWPIAGHS